MVVEYLPGGLVEHEDLAVDVELVVLQEAPLLRVHLLHMPHEPWNNSNMVLIYWVCSILMPFEFLTSVIFTSSTSISQILKLYFSFLP